MERTQVLVVGAGPAGLVTAIGLARHGVATLLVERHLGVSVFPRATGISGRSMEIMRSWGLERAVRAKEFDALPSGRVAPTLVSPQGMVSSLGFATRDQAAPVSPTWSAIAAQDAFEPVLLDSLRTYQHARIRFGTELAGFDQDGEGVTAVLVDRFSGERTSVRADFLVGADGANSAVRGRLGIDLIGPDHLDEYLTTLFRAPLTRHVTGGRHGLNMIVGPGGPAVILPTSDDDRWVYARQWDPGTEELSQYPPERTVELIRAATGVPDLPVRLLSVMAFSFAAQVAEAYRRGRAYLVGDAAHRITPRGGTGMNTAIQDAHNLAWKLAYVARGWAGPDLLDTYEAERRPVGEVNAARSAIRSEQAEPVDPLRGDLGVEYGTPAPAAAEDAGGWRPSAHPGSRAPHVWLTLAGRQVSTLDLFDGQLTVLSGPDGHMWTEAARRLAARTGAPISAHTVGIDLIDHDGAGFLRAYGIGRDGAVLVRPDGYVARRWTTGRTSAGHEGDLRDALAAILGTPATTVAPPGGAASATPARATGAVAPARATGVAAA